MTYMYCASCGLHVRARAGASEIEICPRCLVREATVTPLLMRGARGLGPATGSRCRAVRAATEKAY